MVEFIKKREEKRKTGESEQNRTEGRRTKLCLFGYVYKTGFQTEQYCLHWNFISSDSEDK